MTGIVSPRRLAGSTYLLPGSPNTLLRLVEETGRVSVVDPGASSDRARDIEEAVKSIGGSPGPIILTHGHSDHVVTAKALGWRPVYAPRYCIAFVESLWARRAIAYGGLVSLKHIAHEPAEIQVDYWVMDRNPVPGFRAIWLPGHTPGHTGYVNDEDRIAYVGDAVFGEKVLERFGIPFAYDLKTFVETIEKRISKLVSEGYTIVPSHGPVTEGGGAKALLEANVRKVLELKELVLSILSEKPMTLDKLTVELTERVAKLEELKPRSLLLNRVPVMSLLAWLEEEGRIEAAVSSEGVVWKVKS